MILVKRISLYYEIYGKGYPLLLISGVNADSASWIGVRGRLAERFRVIVFDNRGSGRSDTPKARYSVREMADDAIALLDHLGIERCHIVGHSMGGFIAQYMAIHHPERVGKIVLEATCCVSSIRNIALLNDLAHRFEKDHDRESLMRSWTYWLFSPRSFERKNFIETFIRHASAYPYLQSAAGFRGQIDAIGQFDLRRDVKRIKAKTLVVIGDDDILIYPGESIRLKEAIRGSVVKRIKGVGHCVHVEAPAAFSAEVIKFLCGVK